MKTPLTAPISELPIAVATKFNEIQVPRAANGAGCMGPNRIDGCSITRKRAVVE
jgi:hypothetical protein